MSRAPPSNCLFLPELPFDLTDATLERHFRGFVGFQVARTRHDRNGKLVGFVEFDAVDDAVRARDSMQGASPFEGISWHIHFSNNTKGTPKRPREEMDPPVSRMEAQRPAYSGMHEQRPMYDRPNQQLMPPPPGPPMMQSPSGGYGGPPGPPMYQPMGPGPAGPPGPAGSPMPPNYMSAQLPRDASSTLYVEGLPSDATEREVAHIFRRFEGHVPAALAAAPPTAPPPPPPPHRAPATPPPLASGARCGPLAPPRPSCLRRAPSRPRPRSRISPVAPGRAAARVRARSARVPPASLLTGCRGAGSGPPPPRRRPLWPRAALACAQRRPAPLRRACHARSVLTRRGLA